MHIPVKVKGANCALCQRLDKPCGHCSPLICSEMLETCTNQYPCGLVYNRKYLIIEALEASNLYRCIQLPSLLPFICRILPITEYTDYLQGYLRMHEYADQINQVQEVLICGREALIIFMTGFGDLHSFVRQKKRLKESEAVSLFHQIATIVANCHEEGIVLRDIKLRKFIFADDLKTKLKLETLDDAVLLSNRDDDTLIEKHGCPSYVSPEILTGEDGDKYSGKSSDCWSLGVILYTMLCGRYPFHDLVKIRLGQFHVPPSLSPLVRCLIRSLLRKEPTERLTAQDVLSSKWFEHMQHPCSNYSRYHLAISNLELLERSYFQIANQSLRQSINMMNDQNDSGQISNSDFQIRSSSGAASRFAVQLHPNMTSPNSRFGLLSGQPTMPLNLTIESSPSLLLNESEQSTNSIHPSPPSLLSTNPAQLRNNDYISVNPIQSTSGILQPSSFVYSPASTTIRLTSHSRPTNTQSSLQFSSPMAGHQSSISSSYYLPFSREEAVRSNTDQRVPDFGSMNDFDSSYSNTSIMN